MANGVNIQRSAFPEVIKALNDLAVALAPSRNLRPSIRKLAAELILEGCLKRLQKIKAVRDDSVPSPQGNDNTITSPEASQGKNG